MGGYGFDVGRNIMQSTATLTSLHTRARVELDTNTQRLVLCSVDLFINKSTRCGRAE